MGLSSENRVPISSHELHELLVRLLGLPEDVQWVEIRCGVGEPAKVTCCYALQPLVGEVKEVIKNYTLVEQQPGAKS